MKFICTQKNLNQGLVICEKIIGRNFILPILQNILLSCEKNKGYLKLSSTDLEVGIEVVIPAKIEEEGSITIPAKLFSNFISGLPEGKVEVIEKNKQVSIQCKNYKSIIKSESAKEFPLIPQTSEENIISLRNSEFFYGISSVLNCVSIIDIKPEISGVYVQFNEDDIYFTGTDSFRLSEKKISLDKKNKYPNKVIIPRKTCDILTRIFSEKSLGQNTDEPINFIVGKNQIVIQNITRDTLTPKIKIVSRVIDSEYPNYEQIIPTTFLTSVNISRDELIQHVKTASLFSSKINDVTLKINPKKQEINILSKDQEFGNHSSKITCKIQGEEREIIFNFVYLLDGINSVNAQMVSIKFNQETNPVLISSLSEKNFKYVLMPIKI